MTDTSCLCVKKKKREKKLLLFLSGLTWWWHMQYCFESCQTAVTGSLLGMADWGWKARECMIDGPVKCQQSRGTWWLILTRKSFKPSSVDGQVLINNSVSDSVLSGIFYHHCTKSILQKCADLEIMTLLVQAWGDVRFRPEMLLTMPANT